MNTLAVQGMFRSGTNFTRALFELNYHCEVKFDLFGWKHAYFPIISQWSHLTYPDTPVLVVTKNPFSQLKSLYDYVVTNPKNMRCAVDGGMEGFLRGPCIVFNGHDTKSPEYYFPSPTAYWVGMNWHLVSLSRNRPKTFHLRYEDLLENPRAGIEKVAGELHLRRVSKDFCVPTKRMRNLASNAHDPKKFYEGRDFDRKNVASARYMDAFSDADLELVNSEVPDKLMEILGYSRVVVSLAGSN